MMSRRSRPTHEHIHDPEHERTAVDYLEDNEYRRNTLPKSADWETRTPEPGLATVVYDATTGPDQGITISLEGHQPREGFAHSLDVANEVKIPLDRFTVNDVQSYL